MFRSRKLSNVRVEVNVRRLAPRRSFLLADLVLSKKHVWDPASDLVDMLAVWAHHLTLDDVNLLPQRRQNESFVSTFVLPSAQIPLHCRVVLTSNKTRCNALISSSSSNGFDGSGPWSGNDVSPKLLAVLTSAGQSSLGRKPLINVSFGSASMSSS